MTMKEAWLQGLGLPCPPVEAMTKTPPIASSRAGMIRRGSRPESSLRKRLKTHFRPTFPYSNHPLSASSWLDLVGP